MADEKQSEKAREYFEIERQERERLLREEKQFGQPTTEIVHEKSGGEGSHAGLGTDDAAVEENPPRTTRDGITSPKFGSAGSGGAEFEPGPIRD